MNDRIDELIEKSLNEADAGMVKKAQGMVTGMLGKLKKATDILQRNSKKNSISKEDIQNEILDVFGWAVNRVDKKMLSQAVQIVTMTLKEKGVTIAG